MDEAPEDAPRPDSESSEAWERARELFLDITELEPAQREAALAELDSGEAGLAAWVRRLLAQDTEPSPALQAERAADTLESFGPYRAIRRIGAGGMGEVFLARRSDGEFEREVAVKRLHPGMPGEQLLQRFLRERQTLARLDHEYIARLLDAGRTQQGEPYLVLEYVEGRPIDAYCREEALDTRARVELFLMVLKAVQSAHDRGVIHRDLKPSNVLVRADGRPRLLDFGIARVESLEEEADARLTGTGQRLFTPEYASPEQVRGEATGLATDVFSLGVILYELLCDVGPWDGSASPHELERCILEQEPPPPSRRGSAALRRALAGDLDTIALACLAKQPAERFRSVAELTDELERHLHGLPIRRRATGVLGRLLRHSRRNPWRALAALTLLAAVPVGVQAWRSEQLADQRQQELASSLDGRIVQARNLRTQDHVEEARAELSSILASLESLPDEPRLEMEALVELALVQIRARHEDEALLSIERAMRLRPQEPSVWVSTQARALLAAASCSQVRGAASAPGESARAAYDYTRRWLEPGHDLRLESCTAYAGQVDSPLDLDERLSVLGEALAEGRGRDEPRNRNLGSIQLLRGRLLVQSRRYEEALAAFEETLEIVRWHHGEGHGDVALVRDARGTTLRRLLRHEEALVELEAALEVFEELGHEEKAARTLRHIGELEWDMGETEAGIEDMSRALEALAELQGPDSHGCAELHSLIGLARLDLQLWSPAAASLEESLRAVSGRVRLATSPEAEARLGLARALLMLGEPGRAVEQLRITIELRTRETGPGDLMVSAARRLLQQAERALAAEAARDGR